MDLQGLRNEIDSVDDQIITLLVKRFELTKMVGDYKKTANVNILDTSREEAILSKCPNITIKEIYQLIMDLSKESQK